MIPLCIHVEAFVLEIFTAEKNTLTIILWEEK